MGEQGYRDCTERLLDSDGAQARITKLDTRRNGPSWGWKSRVLFCDCNERATEQVTRGTECEDRHSPCLWPLQIAGLLPTKGRSVGQNVQN